MLGEGESCPGEMLELGVVVPEIVARVDSFWSITIRNSGIEGFCLTGRERPTTAGGIVEDMSLQEEYDRREYLMKDVVNEDDGEEEEKRGKKKRNK